MRVIVFLGDTPDLRGPRIAGLRVLVPLHDLERISRQTGATEVVVTIANAPEGRLAIVRDGCAAARGSRCPRLRNSVAPSSADAIGS